MKENSNIIISSESEWIQNVIIQDPNHLSTTTHTLPPPPHTRAHPKTKHTLLLSSRILCNSQTWWKRG